MKKYLLSLLIAGLSFVGYSSAININCSCEYTEEDGAYCAGTCSSSVSLKACRVYNVDSVQTNAPDDSMVVLNVNFDYGNFALNWGMGGMSNIGDPGLYTPNFSPSPQSFLPDFDTDFSEQELPLPEVGTIIYANFVLSDGGVDNTQEGCEDYVDDSTDGPDVPVIPDNPDNPDNPGDSSNLISQFTPVITGLSNSIKEFIPYVVFIGIGVLSALLGFFAIRWLINWVRGKSLGVFSSGRRK